MRHLYKKIVLFALTISIHFVIVACGGDSSSPGSLDPGTGDKPVEIINEKTAPSAPARLHATAGDAAVTLSWSAGLRAESYTLWYHTEENSSKAKEYKGDDNNTDTKCLVKGLENKKKYYFWVKSVNSKGTSPFSLSASATPKSIGGLIPGGMTLSAGDVTVVEGTDVTPGDYTDDWTEVKVPVTLSQEPEEGIEVTVKWNSIGDDSVMGYDTANRAFDQVISFKKGESLTKYAIVEVHKDSYCEHTETFKVVLNDAVNATVVKAEGVVTIEDDDEAPYTIKIGDAVKVKEGKKGETVKLRYPINIEPALKEGDFIKVHWDYLGTAEKRGETRDFDWIDSRRHVRSITINQAGYTSGGFLPVEVFGDDYVESDETVILKLEDIVNARPVAGQDIATGIIENDDVSDIGGITASVKNALVTVSEGGHGTNQPINVEVALSEPVPAGKTVSIQWKVLDVEVQQERAKLNKDYTGAASGILTIAEGEQGCTIQFNTIGDFIAAEGDKKFKVVLLGSAQVMISKAMNTTLCTIKDVGVSLVNTFDTGHEGSSIYNLFPAIAPGGILYHIANYYDGTVDGTYLYRLDDELKTNHKFYIDEDVRVCPTLGDTGEIYISTEDNYFRELLFEDSFKVVNEIAVPQFGSSPALGLDGTIYGHDREDLYVIKDSSSQKVLDQSRCSDAGPVVGTDGTIYTAAGYYFYAFNTDGSEKWKISLNKMVQSTPAIGKDGRIYVGTDDDYYGDSEFYCIDPNVADKKVVWTFNTVGHILASPVIDKDGNIYFGTAGYDDNTGYNKDLGYFYSLTPAGELRWRYDMNKKRVFSTAAIGSSGTIYIGCDDGYLYAFNADGTVKWKYHAGRGITGSITIYKNIVYVANDRGNLHALRVEGEDGLNSQSPWPKFQCDIQNSGRAKRN